MPDADNRQVLEEEFPRHGWENRLRSIALDCREKNWDSYGADPVSIAALRVAHILCKSLDVVPMVDGGVQIAMASEALAFELAPDGSVDNVYADLSEVASFVAKVIERQDADK